MQTEAETTQEELQKVKAERDRLRHALQMIAGERQCIDNLMSDKDIARAALES